jgi:hypothetical protein
VNLNWKSTRLDGHDFEYKICIIQKFTRRRVYVRENHFEKFPKIVELTLAYVLEIIRDIVNVPDSFEEYCDTRIGADEDNPVDRSDYEDYRKRADRLSKVVTKNEIMSIPVMRVLPEPEIIDNKELLEQIKKHTARRAQKKHGATVVNVNDPYEYNRLQEYHNNLQYNEKLMKQYGYDEITGEFNRTLFPVPKSDRELEGIKKDIDKFFRSFKEYNDFIRYLAQKYDTNIGEEELSANGVIILHEPKDKTND